jgi:hypothetical protein
MGDGVPVPPRVCVSGNGNGQADPRVALAGDASRCREACEDLTEALISHAQDPAEGGSRETRGSGAVQGGEEGGVDVGGGRGIAVIAMGIARDDRQVQVSLGADEGKGDRFGCARGAMLGGEQEVLAVAAEGECGIDPGEEV